MIYCFIAMTWLSFTSSSCSYCQVIRDYYSLPAKQRHQRTTNELNMSTWPVRLVISKVEESMSLNGRTNLIVYTWLQLLVKLRYRSSDSCEHSREERDGNTWNAWNTKWKWDATLKKLGLQRMSRIAINKMASELTWSMWISHWDSILYAVFSP